MLKLIEQHQAKNPYFLKMANLHKVAIYAT
jgi:hypothetical protein